MGLYRDTQYPVLFENNFPIGRKNIEAADAARDFPLAGVDAEKDKSRNFIPFGKKKFVLVGHSSFGSILGHNALPLAWTYIYISVVCFLMLVRYGWSKRKS